MDDRYQPRRDVSNVSVLDGYAASRCPVRVVLDHASPPGLDPLPTPAAIELRLADGSGFELGMMAQLSRLEGAVGIDRSLPRAEQQRATRRAMADGASIILGGWLEDDEVGRRTGRPDVLLQAEQPGLFHPVEIKAHKTMRVLERQKDDDPPQASARLSPLDEPHHRFSADVEDRSILGGRRLTNGLQLAHYYRLLEAMGHASAVPMAGVIGREEHVLWLDLDAPEISTTWDRAALESLLQRYDMEFSFRLDALSAEQSGEPIVVPVKVHDCETCHWRHHCLPIIAGRNCVSTVQGVGYTAWRTYRKMGVDTVTDLTAVHWPSANVADNWKSEGLQLADVVAEPLRFAELVADPDNPLGSLLVANGFETVHDLDDFDHRVLLSVGYPTGRLAAHIDAARAVELRPNTALLRRGLDRLAVPEFDREIDIDMESEVGGLAYLWGVYEARKDRADHDVDWTSDPRVAAAKVFEAFWCRLNDLMAAAERAGESIGFFCWHDEAEKRALRSGAEAAAEVLGLTSAPREVDSFLERGLLVDLCEIARRDLITGGSKSLKSMAPRAGFGWRDDTPDGAESMVWHANAVDPDHGPEEQQAWRTRLLEYNEDDVRAEAAVREWMRTTPFSRAADLD